MIQFFVLFAGPIGLLALTGFVVSRWVLQSRRRERCAPQLHVVAGGAKDDPEQPAARP
jgi:hypothetical protein